MGASEPSVSVVISTLNAARTLETLLRRLMGQGRQPGEIICLDAGSTDGTRALLDEFPLARLVEVDQPGATAWNRAMEAARGELVAFLAQDAIPANGDWLSHLVGPFGDPSVAGVYGRQQATIDSDPIEAFRLAQRYCLEPHTRRLRIGDRIRYKSLPFFIENAAVRRSVWTGIHFNHRLPLGADRVWARQVILASCTIAYAPEALVVRSAAHDLKARYQLARLTGFTDAHFGDEGGTLWPDSRKFGERAAWYLLKGLAWGRLPSLALGEVLARYGYWRGRRLPAPHPTTAFPAQTAAPQESGLFDDQLAA